jgi:subtilisin family serine protease
VQEKHVILRAITATPARGGFLSGTPGGAAAEPQIARLDVAVDEFDKSRSRDLARDPDIIAIAPVIPLQLIQPLTAGAAQPGAAGVDWGVEAVGAGTSPFTGDGIVVAVLDTGIDSSHEAFKGVTLVENNFTEDADGSDQHGHGTHCAGTIFGRDVNGVRIGVARGVRKALIAKVIGKSGAASDQIARAILWAVNEGASVISMSLGIDFPGVQKKMQDAGFPPQLATSRALDAYRLNVLLFEKLTSMVKSLAEFRQTAAVVVAAAGNESKRDVDPKFAIAVVPPAVSDGIISVAAVGRGASGFVVAPFSNTGAKVAGPGVDITSAKPGGGLTVMSGTSMATPHVAGVAALWAQRQRTIGPLSSGLLAARLEASGDTAVMQKPFNAADVGAGMVRAPQS